MRRAAKSLSLPAAILVAILVMAGLAVGAAGCAGAGSAVKGAISSAASNLSSRSATAATATTAGQSASTAPPATAASGSAVLQSSTAAPAAGSGTSLIWLWILLAAVLAAVLIAWITRVSRRGPATAAADWRSRLVDAYAQLRIADALASLQAARSAMDAERAPGGAGPWQAEVVHGRLDAFESSLRALRTDDQRYP
jgi:hypothetical protein